MWQADGTLAQLAGDKGVLMAMLEPLCGWGCAKEGDAGVRESLAEALMMLVGCLGSLDRHCPLHANGFAASQSEMMCCWAAVRRLAKAGYCTP